MEQLEYLINELHQWSDVTFGKYRTSRIMVAHLKKEVTELDEALFAFYQGCYSKEILQKRTEDVREEFADCFLLLFDAASHFSINAEMILSDMKTKLEINKSRKWGKPNEEGFSEHIKEENEPARTEE